MSELVHDGGSNDLGDSSDNNQDAVFQANNFQPILKLPVELLCRVFHMNRSCDQVSISESAELSNHEDFYKTLGWVAVSWVCQSWRRVALSDSALWHELPLDFPKWATVMLERSQNAGFIVEFNPFFCSPRGKDIVLPAIFANASRVAELMLSSDGPKDMLKLLAHFSSTPKLSALRLS